MQSLSVYTNVVHVVTNAVSLRPVFVNSEHLLIWYCISQEWHTSHGVRRFRSWLSLVHICRSVYRK